MKNKVSVIMAVYNSSEYLSQALDSVINQTLKDIEIICVDDGSTDNSVEILNAYSHKDDRITVLHHRENTPGAAGARNMGLDYASGEYLSFLDSDDFFEPEMLENAYNKAKETESEVALWDGYIYDSKLKIDYYPGWLLVDRNLPDEDVFSPEEIKDNLFRINPGAAWNVLFKHEMVKRNNLRFADAYITDDQVFVYTAFTCAKKITVIKKRLLHYRRNNGESQTAKATEHPEAGFAASVMLMDELKRRGKWDQYKVAFANMALEAALGYLDEMQTEDSFNSLFYSMKNQYIDSFGLQEIPDEMYADLDQVRKYKQILKGSPEEYLLKQYHSPMKLSKFEDIISRIDRTSRVIIYGAGDYGRLLFDDLYRFKICEICGWVDRDYERLGFPISSPSLIKEKKPDIVLISIKNPNIEKSVREFLLEMGVDAEKIIWIFESRFKEI